MWQHSIVYSQDLPKGYYSGLSFVEALIASSLSVAAGGSTERSIQRTELNFG